MCVVLPLVCGWWLEERTLREILSNDSKCLQNLDTNWDPWSLIMLYGRPWSRKTSLITTLVVSSLLMLLRNGIKCAIFVNRSIIIRIVSKPLQSGKYVVISEEIDWQGHSIIGKGCNNP